MDTASVKAKSATAMAIGAKVWMVCQSKSGLDSGGKPMRSAPMLPTPVCSRPQVWFMA